jgi:uncharacterized protein with HEPN domain
MPSDPSHSYLIHIRDNRRLAQSFVEPMSYAEFQADIRTVYAVIRCLEIISEASRRVDAGVKGRHPELPWTDIAGAGNIYRHDYENARSADLEDRQERVARTSRHRRTGTRGGLRSPRINQRLDVRYLLSQIQLRSRHIFSPTWQS